MSAIAPEPNAAKPPLLVPGALRERLSGWKDRYDLHCLEDFDDVESFLAGIGQQIEVIVSDGNVLPSVLLREMPRLQLVACFSTGYAGIDAAILRQRGIAFTTAAGVNAHDVADHACALMLAMWHGLLQADSAARRGDWRESTPARRSLRGCHLGIVGFGRIGAAIATRMAAHQMSIAWHGPNNKPEVMYPRLEDIRTLAEVSDILVVASRATPENRHHVGEAELLALGREGMLVNVSRGMLVDEDALIRCLKEGRLGAAALDVFENEPTPPERWRDVPNVLLTPHIGGYTREAGPAMVSRLEENVRRYFAREPLLTPEW
ncbi:MAG TPA: NAD(P)-dependent oxidoreductase [Steroidobacteraceae bacterium]|nr:NAD(P)-dependent oxidoreductase [Steroidobacteraceae bacterium]